MKSVPANSVARSRHVRTGVSISLGALTLAMLWFAYGSLPHNAMAAALAIVPTVPTVPTIPTVPTETPTGTEPTATPTATRPTATPTTVAARNFSLTITYEPNPPVPGQPLIFTIQIKNTGNVLLPGVKIIVIIPEYTSYQTAVALRSAGWQCNGTDAGDTCEYTVGDMAVNVGDDLPFGVQLDRTVLSGTEIVLNARAVTTDGFALNGSTGTDGEAVVQQTVMLLPWVTTD